MSKINWSKTTLINLVVFFLFLIDRILKLYFKKLSAREFFVLGEWLKLKFAFNPGIAFGLPFNFYLLLALYVLVIVFLVAYSLLFYRQARYGSVFLAALVLAGAFSNLIDRIRYGGVIDYFDLKYYSFFNLSDVMIACGIIGLVFINFKKEK